MNMIKLLALGVLLGSGGLTIPNQKLQAAEPKAAADAKEKDADKGADSASKAVPFQGKVSAVDAAARTFTLNGKTKDKERTFKVPENAQILQNNQPVEFKAIIVGELLRGQAYKKSEGWEAKKVMIGPKEDISGAK